MTDEELARIKTRAEQIPGSSLAKTQKEISQAFFDRTYLVREYERLHAENGALRAAIEDVHEYIVLTAWDTTVGRRIDEHMTERTSALLAAQPYQDAQIAELREFAQLVASGDLAWRDTQYEYEHCFWCDAPEAVTPQQIQHKPDCWVTKARAWLAAHPATHQQQQEEAQE